MGTTIPKQLWDDVCTRYMDGLSMREVGNEFKMPLNAVTYVLRKRNIPRRSAADANHMTFMKKAPSFSIRSSRNTHSAKLLDTIGAILYWGEGYKSNKASGIDFTNSDPDMVRIFIYFLRSRYTLDESRFRILLYCHDNQNVPSLIKFWSKLLSVPQDQFIKPYIRKNNKGEKGGRRMDYGMVHVRYHDKKLLLDVLNLLESIRLEYLRRW